MTNSTSKLPRPDKIIGSDGTTKLQDLQHPKHLRTKIFNKDLRIRQIVRRYPKAAVFRNEEFSVKVRFFSDSLFRTKKSRRYKSLRSFS